MKHTLWLLTTLLPYYMLAQCAVPTYVINDQTTAEDILRIKRGISVQDRKGESFIWRLDLIQCEYSEPVMQMVTSSGTYWFVNDFALLEDWLSAANVERFYHDHVRDNENWRHDNFNTQFRCTAWRSSGARCKRMTYSEHRKCWQHL